jgi:Flp pilus assembly protein TadD
VPNGPFVQVPELGGTPTRGRRRHAVACAVPAILAVLVYLNALHNVFVYDDHRLIVENLSIQHLFDFRAIVLSEMTRPVVNFSYALDRAIWGPAPFGFHFTNVLLHALNTILLFQLALRLLDDARRRGRGLTIEAVRPELVAFGAAILFAVHPIMTEAVAYPSGRSEVLCTAFFLGAFLAARRWMLAGGRRWWLLSLGFWLGALGSKEIGAMLPFVLLAYDRIVVGGTSEDRRRRLLRLHLPFIGLAVAGAVVRVLVLVLVEHHGDAQVRWEFLLVDIDVVRRYLGLIFLPEGQSIFHAVPLTTLHDPRAYASVLVILGLLAAARLLRKSEGPVALGLVWFLLLLVPSALLVMLDRGEPMAEHRVYLAAAGLFLAVATVVEWLVARAGTVSRRVEVLLTIVFCLAVVSLTGRTLLRNVVWGNAVGLWQEARDRAPDSWLPHLLLGEALHAEDRHFEAVAEYSEALKLRPQEEFTYRKLGLCLLEMQQYDAAESLFQELRREHPDSTVASLGLGAVAMARGDVAQARTYFGRTLEQDQNDVTARQQLAQLDEPDNPAEALRLCREIRALAPRTPGNDECIERNEARLQETGHQPSEPR